MATASWVLLISGCARGELFCSDSSREMSQSCGRHAAREGADGSPPNSSKQEEAEIPPCTILTPTNACVGINLRFLMIALAYAVPTGVISGWSGVLDMILTPANVSQVDAGWIGFWSTIGGCVFGVAMARFADSIQGMLKLILVLMLAGASLSATWFTLTCLSRVTHLPSTAGLWRFHAVQGQNLLSCSSPPPPAGRHTGSLRLGTKGLGIEQKQASSPAPICSELRIGIPGPLYWVSCCYLDLAILYTSCILVGIFINSSVPIFFELVIETVYPVPEGITCGVITFLGNLVTGLLLFFLTFYSTEASLRSLLVQSQSLLVQSQDLLVQSRPLLVQSQPLLVQSQSLLVQSQSLLVQFQPLLVQSQPLLVQSQPLLSQSLLSSPSPYSFSLSPYWSSPSPYWSSPSPYWFSPSPYWSSPSPYWSSPSPYWSSPSPYSFSLSPYWSSPSPYWFSPSPYWSSPSPYWSSPSPYSFSLSPYCLSPYWSSPSPYSFSLSPYWSSPGPYRPLLVQSRPLLVQSRPLLVQSRPLLVQSQSLLGSDVLGWILTPCDSRRADQEELRAAPASLHLRSSRRMMVRSGSGCCRRLRARLPAEFQTPTTFLPRSEEHARHQKPGAGLNLVQDQKSDVQRHHVPARRSPSPDLPYLSTGAIPNADVAELTWLNWCLTGSCLFSLVLILFFRESYDRLYLDVFVSV
ncbi:Disrupted in renal carcinoma protein 2 [Takifugu flavidus]|uniref:Disrupted in renal carcinoma protein 2 n=1 Tax=Takifugu flavidus TaxID=433684 RepID=A0A5C6PQ16_9TELE|nr:Disrupted in renal carcinoma protein 2 [Takifugu flavidus]